MAITKAAAIDKITIRSPYNHIELRTATVIVEDDVELATMYSHELVKCGALSGENLVDTDMSGYSTEIQGIASAIWTDSVKAAYKASLS